MKNSQRPTDHFLVRANTNFEWDDCNFAIIGCGGHWKEKIEKRLNSLSKIERDDEFMSMGYDESGVDFYLTGDPEIDELLSEADEDELWCFIEFEPGEEEKLEKPESYLNSRKMSLYEDGSAQYTAYGRNKREEFFTDFFPLREIIERMR